MTFAGDAGRFGQFSVVYFADMAQVRKHRTPRLTVADYPVRQIPFFTPPAQLERNGWTPKLGHRREQVVDDLTVQIAHYPTYQRALRGDIHAMLDRIADPRRVLLFFHDVGRRMRQRKVTEEVHVAPPCR